MGRHQRKKTSLNDDLSGKKRSDRKPRLAAIDLVLEADDGDNFETETESEGSVSAGIDVNSLPGSDRRSAPPSATKHRRTPSDSARAGKAAQPDVLLSPLLVEGQSAADGDGGDGARDGTGDHSVPPGRRKRASRRISKDMTALLAAATPSKGSEKAAPDLTSNSRRQSGGGGHRRKKGSSPAKLSSTSSSLVGSSAGNLDKVGGKARDGRRSMLVAGAVVASELDNAAGDGPALPPSSPPISRSLSVDDTLEGFSPPSGGPASLRVQLALPTASADLPRSRSDHSLSSARRGGELLSPGRSARERGDKDGGGQRSVPGVSPRFRPSSSGRSKANDAAAALQPGHFNRNVPIVPACVRDCVTYLYKHECWNDVGLFRVPGHQGLIREAKRRYDRGKPVDVGKACENANHTVAGLLKLWLRELPEPLCTFELYDAFMAAAQVPLDEDIEGDTGGAGDGGGGGGEDKGPSGTLDAIAHAEDPGDKPVEPASNSPIDVVNGTPEGDSSVALQETTESAANPDNQVDALSGDTPPLRASKRLLSSRKHKRQRAAITACIRALPPGSQVVLHTVLALLQRVVDHVEMNKMDAGNLAIVFGPCLLRSRVEATDVASVVADMGKLQSAVKQMILLYDIPHKQLLLGGAIAVQPPTPIRAADLRDGKSAAAGGGDLGKPSASSRRKGTGGAGRLATNVGGGKSSDGFTQPSALPCQRCTRPASVRLILTPVAKPRDLTSSGGGGALPEPIKLRLCAACDVIARNHYGDDWQAASPSLAVADAEDIDEPVASATAPAVEEPPETRDRASSAGSGRRRRRRAGSEVPRHLLGSDDGNNAPAGSGSGEPFSSLVDDSLRRLLDEGQRALAKADQDALNGPGDKDDPAVCDSMPTSGVAADQTPPSTNNETNQQLDDEPTVPKKADGVRGSLLELKRAAINWSAVNISAEDSWPDDLLHCVTEVRAALGLGASPSSLVDMVKKLAWNTDKSNVDPELGLGDSTPLDLLVSVFRVSGIVVDRETKRKIQKLKKVGSNNKR